jgi:hypothetical protein
LLCAHICSSGMTICNLPNGIGLYNPVSWTNDQPHSWHYLCHTIVSLLHVVNFIYVII